VAALIISEMKYAVSHVRRWLRELPSTLAKSLDDDRPLSGGLSVGAFPHNQGGGQDAHGHDRGARVTHPGGLAAISSASRLCPN